MRSLYEKLVTALILPVRECDLLHALAADPKTAEMSVDLMQGETRHERGTCAYRLPPDIRDDLVAGRDAIAAALERAGAPFERFVQEVTRAIAQSLNLTPKEKKRV